MALIDLHEFLTPEVIVQAYRLILGRCPEESEVRMSMAYPTLAALQIAMFRSNEFRTVFGIVALTAAAPGEDVGRESWKTATRAMANGYRPTMADALAEEAVRKCEVDLDLFLLRLERAFAVDDVGGALAFWHKHADAMPRVWQLYTVTGRLLRTALQRERFNAELVVLMRCLLTAEPGEHFAWSPFVVDLIQEVRKSGQAGMQDRLRGLFDEVLEESGLPPTLTAAICRLLLVPDLPYEAFEPLADDIFRRYSTANSCLKLFDYQLRSPVDRRRYLRRYLDENQPASSRFDENTSAEDWEIARCFLLLASTLDQETMDEVLRRLRAAPVSSRLAVPGTWPADATDVADRFRLPEDPPSAPAVIQHRSRPLNVALCVSGQLRGFRRATESWRNLSLDGHRVTTVVHTWQDVGQRFPDNSWQAARVFSGRLHDGLLQAAGMIGFDHLIGRYPSLFGLFRQRCDVTLAELQQHFFTEHVRIEDDALPPFAGLSNPGKMYYKVEAALGLALDTGIPFDLVVRMRPDKVIDPGAGVDWDAILDASVRDRAIYCDAGLFLNIGFGYSMGDQFAVGPLECMVPYSRTWSVLNNPNRGAGNWLPQEPTGHSVFPYVVLRAGIRARALPGVGFGDLLSNEPVTAARALPLIEQDIGPNPRDAVDALLLAVCRDDAATELANP